MFPSKEENCIVVVNRKSSTEFLSDIEPLTQVVHITFKRAVTLISTPFVAFTLRGKKTQTAGLFVLTTTETTRSSVIVTQL